MTSQSTRIAAYGIIADEDRILLCRLSANIQTYGGMWTLPGGGIEFGEHPEEAVVREVEEETGLTVRPTKLAHIDVLRRSFPDVEHQTIRIMYHAEVVSGSLRYEEEGTTDKCEWHAIESLSELRVVGLVVKALELLE